MNRGVGGAEDASVLGFEEFERRGLEGAFRAASKVRLFVLGVIVAFAGWICIADPATWRRVVLAVIVCGLVLGESVATRRFARPEGVERASVHGHLAVMIAVQLVAVFSTGGLMSPVLPAMLPSAFIAGLLADRWGVRRLVWGLQIPALVTFLVVHAADLVPTLVPLPFRSDGNFNLTRLVLVGWVMGMLVSGFSVLGSRLRQAARLNLENLQSAQVAALEVHRQRADDLTLMSGEIAHELKNPLASVKGLTQLLSRGSSDAKTTERLGVLAREVSRMQAILDEFLNFSRPLTPLTTEHVDLRSVCSDAVTLHEAMAASASVTIHLEVEPGVSLEGDSRKVGQVIINLLQNALEVAPRASTVELSARGDGEVIEVEVRDRGPGLDAEPGIDVFAPGVTTKAAGNGLGLTISRAIAEQHGGALVLLERQGGGCVARLTLPRRQDAR
ncbi:MAG: sensor histidine kinase [Nannocystaceae bacterium]|nr:HAMP domain-containing histidine kinase [bacterium]